MPKPQTSKADAPASPRDNLDDGLRRRRLRQPRTLISGYINLVGRMADAAEQAAFGVVDSDPRFDARTSGDVLRQTPDALRSAALAVNGGLLDVNDAIVDFLDLRNWTYSDVTWPMWDPAGKMRTRAPGDADVASDADIVREARATIRRTPHQGILLSDLVSSLAGRTDRSEDDIKTIIGRHFVLDGDLVRTATPGRRQALPAAIEAQLKALGYTDLRRNVPLERLDDPAATARLVAFENDKPMVLVYVVVTGQLGDPLVDAEARFEAKALSRTSSARYVYLTSGAVNRYLDVENELVLAELPRATMSA